MRLALVIYQYFPHGGLQRDFRVMGGRQRIISFPASHGLTKVFRIR